jgi:tetratricopeptide (TPR) repeat protein
VLLVPAELHSDADLRAAAALAVAETFGLLDPARAAATVALVRRALAGMADEALERAPPEVVLAWCIAAIEWCERNGLDREFAGLQARAARADAHPAAPTWARVHWRIAAAWHHEAFGRCNDVVSTLEQAQEIADRSDDLTLQVAAWLKRARLALARRTPQAALVLAQRAAAHADETVAPLWLGDVADVTSTAALAEGDMHRALQQSRLATGLAELGQATPAFAVTYRLNEGYALLGLGAWDDAVALFRELAAIPLPVFLVNAASRIWWTLRLPWLATPPGLAHYLRHPWVMSADRLRRECGFECAHSSAEAFRTLLEPSTVQAHSHTGR